MNNFLKQMIANQFQINSLVGLIFEKAQSDEIQNLVSEFKTLKKVDLKEHSFYNQYTLMSSLYTFIALPKELHWERIPDNIMLNDLDDKWGLKNGWTIQQNNNKTISLKYFLRRLRNGINHGKISCDENLIFSISDENLRDENDKIEITVEFQSLDKFTRGLAWWILTDDITLNNL